MRGTTVLCGGLLVALGALSLFEAARIRDDWQGARLMPLVVGVLLIVLGAAHVTLPNRDRPAFPHAASAGRVVLMFSVLVLYVTLLPTSGFLLATAAFVLVVVRALGTFSWALTAVLTAAIAGASHVVFREWLGMPLPAGPFGF